MRARRNIALLVTIAMLLVGTGIAIAVDFGDIVKAFGIGYAVSRFGPQINRFTNSLLAQRGVKWEGATKVVPIISIGRGTHVGAAQVVGPASRVREVRAVGQGEIGVSGQTVRLKTLIPISTTKPGSSLSRVSGVGISAIIDIKI